MSGSAVLTLAGEDGAGTVSIWRRSGAGSWAKVYTETQGGGLRITGPRSYYKDVGTIFALGGTFGADLLVSTDDGASWSNGGTGGGASGWYGVADDGSLYRTSTISGAGGNVEKASTLGGSWSTLLSGTYDAVDASNGYVWAFNGTNGFLYRAALDGTGLTQLTSLGTFPMTGFGHQAFLAAFPCANRFYLFDQFHTNTVYSVDTTDPLAPVLTSGSCSTGGGGTDQIVWATPITNLVGVAQINTFRSGFLDQGSIFQTTDGGSSWTLRAGDIRISNEGGNGAHHGGPSGNGIAADPSDTQKVYVAGSIGYDVTGEQSVGPYKAWAWVSEDQGTTWAAELVTSAIGALRTPPSVYYLPQWWGAGVAGQAICTRPPPVPGIGVYLATAPNTQFRFTEIT